MTADSKMPDKYYWDAGNAHAHMALSGVYVEWIESRLARTEAALKAAKEALTYYSEYFGGPLVYSKATLALAQIAALEGKP